MDHLREMSTHVVLAFLLALFLLTACQPTMPTDPTPASIPTSLPPTPLPTEIVLPTFTLAPLPIQIPFTNNLRQNPARTPRVQATETFTPTLDRPYPVEYHITNISGHRQIYPLGCESSTAVDWASYFGVEINELILQSEMPQSDNPDKGFVGDVRGEWGQIPPHAYGVHAEPVAILLRKYGLDAQAYKDFSLERLKVEIAHDRPVIAWVIGNVISGRPVEFVDMSGDKVTVAAFEHVVIVTGYDENSDRIRYMNEGRFYEVSTSAFLDSWGVLGNMVVVEEKKPIQ